MDRAIRRLYGGWTDSRIVGGQSILPLGVGLEHPGRIRRNLGWLQDVPLISAPPYRVIALTALTTPNRRGKEAADAYCLALRRNADPKKVPGGLTLAYALHGPARCVDTAHPIQCAKQQPPPDFPDWKPPLDFRTCENGSSQFPK